LGQLLGLFVFFTRTLSFEMVEIQEGGRGDAGGGLNWLVKNLGYL